MSDSALTARSAARSDSSGIVQEFTIEVMTGQTADGETCWKAATATESSTAAGGSATPSEALRRLALVRTRRQREWPGDAWVTYTPRPSASIHESEPQFTVRVTLLSEPDEHGRKWSASTDGYDPETGGFDRTMGTALRDLARSLSDIPRSYRTESDRPALPEHQVKMLLEAGRGLRFRADADARVAACFDRDGHRIGQPKTFVDGEAVGPRQGVEWPDGIVLSFDRPGIVYDDLRRQFKAAQNRGRE